MEDTMEKAGGMSLVQFVLKVKYKLKEMQSKL